MGITDRIRDSVENIADSVGKVTGGYKHWVYCNKCGKQIDVKYGYNCFRCANCGYILCNTHAEEYMSVRVLVNPGLFRKGRREWYIICPSCGQRQNEGVEEFR